MSDEEIEIKDEALSPEEINSFWKRLKKTPKATIIAYLITFLTAGGGGYMAAFWQDSVSSAAVEELKDPDSNLSRAISTRVESSMLEALTEVKEDIKEENIRLKSDMEYIERLARERYRMAKKGEKIYKVLPKQEVD